MSAFRGLLSALSRLRVRGGVDRYHRIAEDVKLLRFWRNAPLSHRPIVGKFTDSNSSHSGRSSSSGNVPSSAELDDANQELRRRKGWDTVRFTVTLTWLDKDSKKAALQFAKARSSLLRMDYFPDAENATSDDERAKCVLQRPVFGEWATRACGTIRAGDRFVQRGLLLPWITSRLALVSMDAIAAVYDTERSVGFTVTTSEMHDEIGEHTAVLHWLPDGRLQLDNLSGFTYAPHLSIVPGASKLARVLQDRAHRLSISYLAALPFKASSSTTSIRSDTVSSGPTS